MTLQTLATKPLNKTAVIILDGWGIGPTSSSNAIDRAETPVLDRLLEENPSTSILTHGEDVGLPAGQMGNSEVGHTNIGAGRIVEMDLPRINRVFNEGEFGTLEGVQHFVGELKASGGRAHLLGVLSDGGVHGHQKHMSDVASVLVSHGIEVLLHLVSDGRDVAPKSALNYLEILRADLPSGVEIASISGRYFTMDRNNNWNRTQSAFDVFVGNGPAFADPEAAIDHFYSDGVTDEFFPPARIGRFDGIEDGDGFMCLNFRADRVRQILAVLGDPEFAEFDTPQRPQLGAFSGMAKYSDRHDLYMRTVFPVPDIANTLGEWVAMAGGKQLRIAETEKYPHVTYFLNGGREEPFPNEHRVLIPSPDVATYDLKPEMSAAKVAHEVRDAIQAAEYDLIVVNFANPDMVGHTGDLDAATMACEAVDECLGLILAADGADEVRFLVLADHGNCEVMVDPSSGQPHTSHTINPVPIFLVNAPTNLSLKPGGRLGDVALTVLDLMSLDPPQEMTGRSLLVATDSVHRATG